ncbi:hypothetical protein [Mucilaginibacter lacusdianchii]|uniref:hypothetical protein n=1 Tax=Mucilaginibacter lacusdianchii TaxID=2684211 RepID=UPI00131D631D|nr:hypothetical protein [Mucilaginibacter sp. JXJ CY 39]
MKLLGYKPHRKIYYPAGLISLVLLPALCIWWLHQHKAFEPIRAMDIVFFDSVTNKTFPPAYRIPAKKKYLVLDLTGNDAEDSVSLKYAQLMLKRWKAAKDDTQGVDIHFGKKAKYWTLVEAVNKVKEIGLKTYMPYQDHFYAFWDFHKIDNGLKIKVLMCGTGLLYSQPSACQRYMTSLQVTLKDYWSPLLLFTIMCVSVFSKNRQIQFLRN